MAELTRAGQATALALATVIFACSARAAVAPDEAAALGTTLTGIGAEKAGNADGRIPAYTGGLSQPPAGYKPGDGRLIDPFADEKPLQVITRGDADGSADQLTAGTQELLRRYADFRVDVYPTHRTMAYPEYLVAGTRRNAIDARATDGGLGFENVVAGVPFPIPRDGREVMWNHRLHYMGRMMEFTYDSWLVNSAGQRILTSVAQSQWGFPTVDPGHQAPLKQDEPLFQWRLEYTGPQRRAGEAVLFIESVNPIRSPRHVWQYLPGQRRVRQVDMPDEAPHGSSSGAYTNDDAFVYTGALEHFDVKLLGKREMLVPYNTYRLTYHANPREVLHDHHLNPDLLRWELHRVWVVEATLKPGEQHAYSRRVFYVDEETWAAVASDEYGLDGQWLWMVYSLPSYNYVASVPFTVNHVSYDFGTGNYFTPFLPGPHGGVRYVEPPPAATWSPDALAGAGIR